MIFLTFKDTSVDNILKLSNEDSIIEIRQDLCGFSIEDLEKLFNYSSNFILTIKDNNEKSKEYLDLAIKYKIKFIDLDYRSELLEDFDRIDTLLILSYHNYERTPYEFALQEIISNMNRFEPDIIKIATKGNNKSDALRLLQLNNFQRNIIAFTLGNKTKFSRFASYYSGLKYIYAAIDDNNRTAEGQPTLNEVLTVLNICD